MALSQSREGSASCALSASRAVDSGRRGWLRLVGLLCDLLLDLGSVLFVHPAPHFTECTPGFLRPKRATLEVDADDAHASSVAGFGAWRRGLLPRGVSQQLGWDWRAAQRLQELDEIFLLVGSEGEGHEQRIFGGSGGHRAPAGHVERHHVF